MSIDCFALLGQPRRPCLEAEALKDAFLRLAAVQHPDKTGDSPAFAEINAAYATLSEPATRLRHLLELEVPEVLAGSAPIPEAMAETFMRIATLRRSVDGFMKQQAAATTPLAQALLSSERFTLQREVEKELAELEVANGKLQAAVQEVNTLWPQQKAELAPRLYMLQQEFMYAEKWSAQLREALFGLQG